MNHSLGMFRRTVLAVLLASASLVAPAFAAQGPDGRGSGGNLGNPAVLAPVSNPYGHSYSEWTAIWWRWAYGLPVTGHPLFDETGALAGVGQSGQVWFLGGVFNISGSASRTATIPQGKALFFPIINIEWDNICPPLDPPLSLAGLEAQAKSIADGATDLECDLDGVPIANVSSYRFTSVFNITVPADNIYDAFGCPTAPGTYGPLANDGYYLMLRPLSVGTHHLHFHGSLPGFNFMLDITYTLNVVNTGGNALTLGGDRAVSMTGTSQALDRPAHARTWGGLKLLYR